APFGDLVSQRRGSSTHYFHFDGLGSTACLSDGSATVTDSYLYKAFGSILASSGATTNPFRFVGREGYYRDGDLETYWLRARMYDPVIGRFLSRDPLGTLLGRWLQRDPIEFGSRENNLYLMVRNNPVLFTDVTGLSPDFLPDQWGIST